VRPGGVWRVGGGLCPRLLEWGALQHRAGCLEDNSTPSLQRFSRQEKYCQGVDIYWILPHTFLCFG
jgi:hypothetical protein